MAISRRGFLALGGGLIASATMAQAGALAEYLDWLRRKPAWSLPSEAIHSGWMTFPFAGMYAFEVAEWVNHFPVSMKLIEYPLAPGESIAAYDPGAGVRYEHGDGSVMTVSDLARVPLPSEQAQRNNADVASAILRATAKEAREGRTT
jgi:hypothetical protein